MNRYAIWNKIDPIITPVGEVLTAEQWIQRYPVASLNSITVVCAAGEINGAFFGTLGSMVDMYEGQGCDFSECESAEDKINAINAFIANRDAMMKNTVAAPTVEERIAAALEAQVLMSMPDEEI